MTKVSVPSFELEHTASQRCMADNHRKQSRAPSFEFTYPPLLIPHQRSMKCNDSGLSIAISFQQRLFRTSAIYTAGNSMAGIVGPLHNRASGKTPAEFWRSRANEPATLLHLTLPVARR